MNMENCALYASEKPDGAKAPGQSRSGFKRYGAEERIMAKARNNDLVWQEINPDTLQPEAAKAYRAYKAQYAKAAECRATFQAEMLRIAELPATHTLRFGYNFGKLSVAVDKANTGNKVSKKAVDFASLIKAAA